MYYLEHLLLIEELEVDKYGPQEYWFRFLFLVGVVVVIVGVTSVPMAEVIWNYKPELSGDARKTHQLLNPFSKEANFAFVITLVGRNGRSAQTVQV